MMKKSAFKFIVLLGIVSLFADVTYEGARSITGPYLSVLGASGAAVGTLVGFAEFVGYAVRLFSGYLSDRTKQYWGLTFLGYILNLLAVPALAFAGNWQMAAALIILERFGKAVRVPSRDAMLSYATKEVGRGWGFGLHEFLDQMGAVIGPVVVTLSLYRYHDSYQTSFLILLIPALFALGTLAVSRFCFPQPRKLEISQQLPYYAGIKKKYALYLTGIALVAAGYADFALIAFHFQKVSSIPPVWIPLFYAIAMAIQGLSALGWGKIFDYRGILVLGFATGFSCLFAPLVFLGGFYPALVGMILWGVGMGAQESIMRASVAAFVPPNKRGSAYGVMHFVFGLSWFLGSAFMGVLYDIAPLYLVTFSVVTQIAAVPLFIALKRS